MSQDPNATHTFIPDDIAHRNCKICGWGDAVGDHDVDAVHVGMTARQLIEKLSALSPEEQELEIQLPEVWSHELNGMYDICVNVRVVTDGWDTQERRVVSLS